MVWLALFGALVLFLMAALLSVVFVVGVVCPILLFIVAPPNRSDKGCSGMNK